MGTSATPMSQAILTRHFSAFYLYESKRLKKLHTATCWQEI